MNNKSLIYILLTFFAIIFSYLYWYHNSQFDIQTLTSLNKEMTNPSLIEIKTKNSNNKWMESQFLIIDNDNKNHTEIFYPKTNEIKILPKSSLSGSFQNYLSLAHTPNKFLSLNISKEKNGDTCGIEIFDIDTDKWQKLKTMPVLRNAKTLPSIDIVYTKTYRPLLLIWGGINYETGKAQNTIEIIDLLNDKLIEKANINFKGGKIIQLDNQYYLIGANIIDNKQNVIQFKKIKLNILPFANSNPTLHSYHKIYINTLSSSLDRETLLAINNANKQFIEYEMPNNSDNSIKINKIKFPAKYQKYSLINSINTYRGILLIFANNAAQLILLFDQKENIEQTKNFDYRFKLLKRNSNKCLATAKYLNSNSNKYMSLICINNNNILKITIK